MAKKGPNGRGIHDTSKTLEETGGEYAQENDEINDQEQARG